jgi:hypothetical protein
MTRHEGRGRIVRIGPVTASRAERAWRVAADVDGVPVWFESPDVPLRAAPEAPGSAFLLPALHQRARLALADPVDPAWLANLDGLLAIFHRWWRTPVWSPEARPASAPPNAAAPGATALFFSGGVDSFYSLLKSGETVDALVSVQGFDVPLADAVRWEGVETTLRAVAAGRGLRAIVVRTNLREHPLFAGIPWERSHGGALAGVAHALDLERLDQVLISSSIARTMDKPWGSHETTDPRFGSGRLRLRDVGMELRRMEKIVALAHEPLVQRHLRVCWENRSPSGNCSRCGKCLMTRLVLADCGTLDAFATLAGTATLARDLDALPADRHHLRSYTQMAASPGLDPEIRRAAAALLRRGRHANHPLVQARRAMLRGWSRWLGRESA